MESLAFERLHSTDGKLVVESEQGVGYRPLYDTAVHHPETLFTGDGFATDDQRRIDRKTVFAQSIGIAPVTQTREIDLRRALEMHDARHRLTHLAADVYQMLHGEERPFIIVDDNAAGRNVGSRAVEKDQRNTAADQLLIIIGVATLLGNRDQDAFDHALFQQLQVTPLGLGRFVALGDEHMEAFAFENRLDLDDDPGKKRVDELRNHDADNLRTPLDQVLGERVGAVVHLLCHLHHRLLGLGLDIETVGKRTRHGRLGDSECPCDVFYRGVLCHGFEKI